MNSFVSVEDIHNRTAKFEELYDPPASGIGAMRNRPRKEVHKRAAESDEVSPETNFPLRVWHWCGVG